MKLKPPMALAATRPRSTEAAPAAQAVNTVCHQSSASRVCALLKDPSAGPTAEVIVDPVVLIPLKVFLERAHISRSYWYALRKKGVAPQPVKLSEGRQGAVRLVEAECEAWLAELVKGRAR